MLRNRLVSAALVLCSFALPLGAQVVNGGFETGALAPSWLLSAGCNNVGIDNLFPHSGSLAFFGGPVGSTCDVTQTVATTIGQQYTFAFWLQNDSGGGPNFFQAMFGGQSLETLNNAGQFSYTQHSFSVTAAAASTEIRFTFRNDPSYFELDDVSLTAVATTVPEPSTVALFGAGLLGVAMFRVRRRS